MSPFYKNYSAAFLTGLASHAHVTAELTAQTKKTCYITVSQRLAVNGNPLVVALSACVGAFYALANGYSGVSLDGMDDLAIDAVGELFNVINGHFSSHMRIEGIAVSIIDPPRHYHGAAEPPAADFSHFIESPVGNMRLMAAREEFLAAETH